MPVIEVLLQVSPRIAMGLASGQLERVGGVIVDSASKQVVAWLREGGQIRNNPDPASALPRFLFEGILQSANLESNDFSLGIATLVRKVGAGNLLGILDIAATAHSHHLLTLRLQAIQNMLAFTTRLGMLQLTLAGAGLLMMLKRFADIESLIETVFEQVSKAVAAQNLFNMEIKLNAALECAQVVMEAEPGNFKEAMAASLEFLLIQAREHCLSEFHAALKKEASDNDIKTAQQRLAQAMHIDETRIRAFLEVGQNVLANSVMQERLGQYLAQTQEFIEYLLKDHRAVYFHKKVKETDLRRYLLIEQWLRGEEDILWDVLLKHRKHFWDDKIKDAVDPAPGLVLPGKPAPKPATMHLDALEQAENAIENFQRFEGFVLELKSIERLGISLREWEALRNTENTVFVNKAGVNLDEHDDYVLLVERD